MIVIRKKRRRCFAMKTRPLKVISLDMRRSNSNGVLIKKGGEMRIKFILLAVMITGVLIGCSSTTKFTRDLLITSEPAGAVVYMDGDKIGETPLKIQTFFTWNKEALYDSLLRRVIQVKKDGYVPQIRDLYPIDMPNITFFLSPENAPGNEKGGIK